MQPELGALLARALSQEQSCAQISSLQQPENRQTTDLTLNPQCYKPFWFICWFNGLSVKNKRSLNARVKVCSRIIGVQQWSLCSLWEKQAKGLISQSDHLLSSGFTGFPSGWCCNEPPGGTNCFSKSFWVQLLILYISGANCHWPAGLLQLSVLLNQDWRPFNNNK